MENSTNLKHGEQNKFGTWRTEQIRNMENRTNLEHETSTNLEHGKQHRFGTLKTAQI